MRGVSVIREMDLETTITVVLLVCMLIVIGCTISQLHSEKRGRNYKTMEPFNHRETSDIKVA